VVYAAAIVTWVAAMSTAGFTLLGTVAVLWMADPIFDSFESGLGNPRTFVVGVAAAVFVLSAAACVLAALMLRGYRWAMWVLVGLSVATVLGGVLLAYFVVSLVVTAAAMAVVILLLMPDARAWSRAPLD
jgi:hypothetical protein